MPEASRRELRREQLRAETERLRAEEQRRRADLTQQALEAERLKTVAAVEQARRLAEYLRSLGLILR